MLHSRSYMLHSRSERGTSGLLTSSLLIRMKKKKASNSYISSVLVLLCMNVRVETPVARDARKKKKS